jgi:hypothetical protein
LNQTKPNWSNLELPKHPWTELKWSNLEPNQSNLEPNQNKSLIDKPNWMKTCTGAHTCYLA